eukprot:UN06160
MKAVGKTGLPDDVFQYVLKTGHNIGALENQLFQDIKVKFPESARMCGGQDAAELLGNLIRLSGAKRGFEIGVYCGYSSLVMANALPKDGKLYALDCEEGKPFTSFGETYWEKGGVKDLIELNHDGAVNYLNKLVENKDNHGTYDFAFVDADKT